MTILAPSNATKVLAVTAVLAAILFTVGQAEAGTQMPYWKKLQLLNQPTASVTPATTTTTDEIVVVEEVQPADESEGSGNEGASEGSNWPSDMGNGGDSNPVAAPTPSAVLGGIAMLGLIAGRRRRQQDEA